MRKTGFLYEKFGTIIIHWGLLIEHFDYVLLLPRTRPISVLISRVQVVCLLAVPRPYWVQSLWLVNFLHDEFWGQGVPTYSRLETTLSSVLRIYHKNAATNYLGLKIHYGGLLLRLLRPWGTGLTTPFPLQTSNWLLSLYGNGVFSIYVSLQKWTPSYVRLYSNFMRQRLDQWQWFPSLVLILHLPELRFASQLLLEPPVIPTTRQNNTDKKLNFSTGRVFVQCDKSRNTKLSVLIKYILRGSA